MDLPYQVLKMWAASVASISWVYQYGRHVGCDSVVSTYAPATHIPLMKMIMRKSEQGFYFYRYGAPLGRSSAKKLAPLSQPIISKTKTNYKWPHWQSFWQDFDPERGYLSQFLLFVCRRHPRTPTPDPILVYFWSTWSIFGPNIDPILVTFMQIIFLLSKSRKSTTQF